MGKCNAINSSSLSTNKPFFNAKITETPYLVNNDPPSLSTKMVTDIQFMKEKLKELEQLPIIRTKTILANLQVHKINRKRKRTNDSNLTTKKLNYETFQICKVKLANGNYCNHVSSRSDNFKKHQI